MIWLWLGCVHWTPVQPLVHDINVERLCEGEVLLSQVEWLIQANNLPPLPIRQESSLLIAPIMAVDSTGKTWYNDTFHGSSVQHQRDCKVDTSRITTTPIGGTLTSQWSIRPHHNVLDTIDTGIGIQWQAHDQSGTIRLAPNYDSHSFVPFSSTGPTGTFGDTGYHPNGNGSAYSGQRGNSGSTGKNGTAGSDGQHAWQPGQNGGNGGDGGHGGNGSDGRDGSDATSVSGNGGNGSNGTPGGNGSHGGDGGNGTRGLNGGEGSNGQRGADGPDLSITIRPIYSPFYPDETLIYAEVQATHKDHHGSTTGSSSENYIFHQGQPFTFTSRGGSGGNGGNGGQGGHGGDGGRGGDGGNGGRGGHGGDGGDGGPGDSTAGVAAGRNGNGGNGARGGNGGNGGDGGNGASGGCGGDGANGGRGGDGGTIYVTVYGSDIFKQSVLTHINFQSLGGPGGSRGVSGSRGNSGSSGRAGYAGSAGSGGSGGSGYNSGQSGSSGSSGTSGSSGYSPSLPYCDTRDGVNGPSGTAGLITVNTSSETTK